MRKQVLNIYKKITILCWLIILLLSTSFSAFAMGFDFDEVSKSVFIILSTDETSGGYSLGSGFAIDDTHIVTNAHVVANTNEIVIGSYSETEENNIGDIYIAQVASIDEDIDIAILDVQGANFTPLKMADASTIKEGDDVYAIGTPEGLPYTLTKGTVSSKLRVRDGVKYVQTDAGITHGSSGGPLLNNKGEVIGINTSGSANSENIRFAIRVDAVVQYINENMPNIIMNMDSNNIDETDDETDDETIDSSNLNSPEKEDNNYSGYILIPTGAIASLIATGIALIAKYSRKQKKGSNIDVPVLNDVSNNNETNLTNREQKSNVQNNSAKVCVLSGNMSGAEVEISDGETLNIGKDPKRANLVLDNTYPLVSRMHCVIVYSVKFNKYFVIDCSSNGTYLENGTRLAKNTRTPIARGTVLKLADDNCIIKLI